MDSASAASEKSWWANETSRRRCDTCLSQTLEEVPACYDHGQLYFPDLDLPWCCQSDLMIGLLSFRLRCVPNCPGTAQWGHSWPQLWLNARTMCTCPAICCAWCPFIWVICRGRSHCGAAKRSHRMSWWPFRPGLGQGLTCLGDAATHARFALGAPWKLSTFSSLSKC